MTRRKSREQAFVLIFEKSFNPDMAVAEIVETVRDFGEENDFVRPDDFAAKLAAYVYDNIEIIDELFEKYLKDWKKDRLPKATLAILRLAACEMKFYEEIPVSVSINEAVELAKVYSPDDAPFINGILGSVAKSGELSPS